MANNVKFNATDGSVVHIQSGIENKTVNSISFTKCGNVVSFYIDQCVLSLEGWKDTNICKLPWKNASNTCFPIGVFSEQSQYAGQLIGRIKDSYLTIFNWGNELSSISLKFGGMYLTTD